jgi:hypothetical protein
MPLVNNAFCVADIEVETHKNPQLPSKTRPVLSRFYNCHTKLICKKRNSKMMHTITI